MLGQLSNIIWFKFDCRKCGSSLTLTATSSVVATEDITVSIDGTGGTGTREQTLELYQILQLLQDKQAQLHSLHLMIMLMKEMKQQ